MLNSPQLKPQTIKNMLVDLHSQNTHTKKKDRTKRSERKPLSHYAYSSRSRSFVKIKSRQGDFGLNWNH